MMRLLLCLLLICEWLACSSAGDNAEDTRPPSVASAFRPSRVVIGETFARNEPSPNADAVPTDIGAMLRDAADDMSEFLVEGGLREVDPTVATPDYWLIAVAFAVDDGNLPWSCTTHGVWGDWPWMQELCDDPGSAQTLEQEDRPGALLGALVSSQTWSLAYGCVEQNPQGHGIAHALEFLRRHFEIGRAEE